MKRIFIILFLIISVFAFAQVKKQGTPFIQNFDMHEIDEYSGTSGICEGPDGFIYLATRGLWQYDGVSWKRVAGTEKADPEDVTVFNNSSVYVTGKNDMGFLASDKNYSLSFVSIKKYLPKDVTDKVKFDNVVANSRFVVFKSKQLLIVFYPKSKKYRMINAVNAKYSSLVCYNDDVIFQRADSLYKITDKSIEFISKTSSLKTWNIATGVNNEMILASYPVGSEIILDKAASPWNTEVQAELSKNVVFTSVQLSNGFIAFGTMSNGIIVCDINGKIVQKIASSNGLIGDIVMKIIKDRQGNLWAVTTSGLSRIEISSPFTIIDKRHGTDNGSLLIETRYNSEYISLSNGLFRRDSLFNVKPVTGAKKMFFHLISINGNVFGSTEDGIYKVSEDKITKVGDLALSTLYKLPDDKLFVISANSLNVASFDGLKLKVKPFYKCNIKTYRAVFDNKMRLWAFNHENELLRVTLNASFDSVVKTAKYDSLKGITDPENEYISLVDENIYLFSRTGVKIYDEALDKFVADNSAIAKQYPDNWQNIKTDEWNRKWYSKKGRIICIDEGSSKVSDRLFGKVNQQFLDPLVVYSKSDVIMSSKTGFFHYNPLIPGADTTNFHAVFREIVCFSDTGKKVLFGGQVTDSLGNFDKTIPFVPELPYSMNSIKISFASLFFEESEKTQYQVQLQGYSDVWTEWSISKEKEFTNLPEGSYTLKVRAKNIYETTGLIGVFKFKILPPWYRTWWAYIFYVLLAILLIYIVAKLNSRRLMAANIRLENTVTERTAEILQKNEEIRAQSEQLEMANRELEQQKEEVTAQRDELNLTLERLKSAQDKLIESEKMASLGSLVAGVAHEINTPVGVGITAATVLLDAIKKLADIYEKGELSNEQFEASLERIYESGNLVLSNLNRAGELISSFKRVSIDQSVEEIREIDLGAYAEEVVKSLNPEFKNTSIKIVLNCPERIVVNSYPGAYAQIFTNFLINSKIHGFDQGQQGKINLEIVKKDSTVQIVYSDNGKGIPEANLKKIFDPFFTTNKQKGTGLGMHIIYNLITQRLGGTIRCESEPGKGVKFLIELPA